MRPSKLSVNVVVDVTKAVAVNGAIGIRNFYPLTAVMIVMLALLLLPPNALGLDAVLAALTRRKSDS